MTIVGYLFGLPQQFFASASALGETTQEASASQASQQLPVTTTPSSPARPAWRESGAVCLTCGIGVGCPGFSSPTEQREHFKTDWHRYNVKRRLVKQPAISEEQFERILEQDTEVSISGSESGSSEDDGLDVEDGEGGRGDGLGMADAGHGRKGTQAAASTIPRVTFQAADGSLFTVWRCLLRQDHVKAPQGQPSSPGELLGELRRLRAACGSWMVVLLRGGHFAATVFKAREARPLNSAKHDTDGLDCFDVTAHKTFHRYVVRAKAGGKQSTKDATGKYARSAGSRLRRYNEAALVRDIQELLASWANHVESADLIFVHAPASNARSLFSEGQTTLLPSNPRLRRVPFVTHRPTFSETKRVLRLLCAVFRPDAVEQLLQAQRSAHAEKEAEAAAAAAAGALEAAKLGSTAAVDNTGPSTSGTSTGPHKEEQPQHGAAEAAAASTGTAAAGGNIATEGPLHKAAKAGDAPRVQRLLDSGHDPSIRDAKGRTPYALAADKDTRDVFRRFMAQNMDRWNYAAAGIPSPLTEEMEAAQQAKKAAHKAKLKAKDAERKAAKAAAGGGAGSTGRTESAEERKQALEDEIAKAAAEAEAIAARLTASAKAATSSSVRAAASSSGSGKVGGGAGGGNAGKAAKGQGPTAAAPGAGPTAEEMARRRELMAAAAEARLRALTQVSQQQKLW